MRMPPSGQHLTPFILRSIICENININQLCVWIILADAKSAVDGNEVFAIELKLKQLANYEIDVEHFCANTELSGPLSIDATLRDF